MTRTRSLAVLVFLFAPAGMFAQRTPIPQQLAFTPERLATDAIPAAVTNERLAS